MERQMLEVIRCGRRVDERRQGRRIGGDDQIVGQAALQAEAWYAEGLVLIVAGAVGEGVRRLGDAPRHVTLAPVVHLVPHTRPATLIEQRPRKTAHEQRRQQVLEHGAAP